MIIIIVAALTGIHIVAPFNLAPGVEIPHAKQLDKLLLKFMKHSHLSHGSVVDFLLGNPANDSDTSADLDVNVLDLPTLRKIIKAATKKLYAETRRQAVSIEKITLNENPAIVNQTFRLIKTMVYGTRYRIAETNKYRKLYSGDKSYQIGVYVATIYQISLKMDALYATMKALRWKSHFLWRLICYEKILAASVDLSYSVQRIFQIHEEMVQSLKQDISPEDYGFQPRNLPEPPPNLPGDDSGGDRPGGPPGNSPGGPPGDPAG